MKLAGPTSEDPEDPDTLSTRSSMIVDLQTLSAERWEEFVLLYTPLLRFWICARHVPVSDEDDLLQECLASVASGIHRFNSREADANFRGWLRTIVNRRVADYFRRQNDQPRNQSTCLDAVPDRRIRNREEIEAEEIAFTKLRNRAMELARQSVTQRTWEMFWKSAVEQVPTSEVANEFGVSQAAVRVARGRVLCRLRELLMDETEFR